MISTCFLLVQCYSFSWQLLKISRYWFPTSPIITMRDVTLGKHLPWHLTLSHPIHTAHGTRPWQQNNILAKETPLAGKWCHCYHQLYTDEKCSTLSRRKWYKLSAEKQTENCYCYYDQCTHPPAPTYTHECTHACTSFLSCLLKNWPAVKNLMSMGDLCTLPSNRIIVNNKQANTYCSQ